MITTLNRADELRRTCRVLRRLDPPPLEYLITIDGGNDDSEDVIRAELPAAKIILNPVSKGSVASRDRMMRMAEGELVLALDDDSYPEQTDAIRRVEELFTAYPKLAVAHFPQRTDEYPHTLGQKDFGASRHTNSFPNSAACLRKSVYLSLPGFEPLFFHMYEEVDYALQCIGAGYDVVYHPVLTVRHHWTRSGRNEIKNHRRHARNEVWSVLMRCPAVHIGWLLIYRVMRQLIYAGSQGLVWLVGEPIWWWNAICGIPACFSRRKPIAWSRYRIWLTMAKQRRVSE